MNTRLLTILLASICSLAACDKTDKPHEGPEQEQEHGHKHVFELVKGVQITDCTDGYRDCYRCKDCGLYFEDEEGKVSIGYQDSYNAWTQDPDKGKLLAPDDFLCFTADEAGSTISMVFGEIHVITSLDYFYSDYYKPSLFYSRDMQTWEPFKLQETVVELKNVGDRIYLRGLNGKITKGPVEVNFSMTGKISASGSVMSILDDRGVLRKAPAAAFQYLFKGCTSLVSAPNLPATELEERCYWEMFSGCTGLIEAPELPATVLADFCYRGMFKDCTGLIACPELPATDLEVACYGGMFEGCTGLTHGPELPATNLEEGCYGGMFAGCTGLVVCPELPVTTLKGGCYGGMFKDCTGLISCPELPATTLEKDCYGGMFEGCTGLTHGPELPATDLAEFCYETMFLGCTSMIEAPELPATDLPKGCYRFMFKDCTSLRTAPYLPALDLAEECYQCMFLGCHELDSVKAMFLDASPEYLEDWLLYTAEKGTFIKNPAAVWDRESAGVPEGWEITDAS